MKENPFWQYTLSIYGKEGVEPLLIRLQDECGADVNLLLCACWLGSQGKFLADDHWAGLIKISAQWQAQCVIPIRAVRRFLKTQLGVEDFREQVKTLEIEAERYQQDLLCQQLSGMKLSQADAHASANQMNLTAYTRHLPVGDQLKVSALLVELKARVIA